MESTQIVDKVKDLIAEMKSVECDMMQQQRNQFNRIRLLETMAQDIVEIYEEDVSKYLADCAAEQVK